MAQAILTGHGQEGSIIPAPPHGDGTCTTIQKAVGKMRLLLVIIKTEKACPNWHIRTIPIDQRE